ncbi:hypothetical protein [Corallococcus aberystwythensis]|uniref:Uncharacterized protein n=1 Tax=Corallococcus aberystwythensis TaxID=2316722 RepID=A0A3A8Q323_9BACT|nr:hypothetical protein [Corallococcus aberystwythensis]RKH59272.1 hypothetical protein D7W81_27615 [Corallococcus aberystwythensis]
MLPLAVTALMMLPVLPASALPEGKHTVATAFDMDTASYVGYDQDKKAHHVVLSGRWLPDACEGKFCWPSKDGDIGSDDAVRVNFSSSVDVKAMRVRLFDACTHETYNRDETADVISHTDVAVRIDDKVFKDKFTMSAGGKTATSGLCGTEDMPTVSAEAGTPSGPASSKQWFNMKAAQIHIDMWFVPFAPVAGQCPRLKIKSGYAHTWSKQELTWSAGPSLTPSANPLSLGLGMGVATKPKNWAEWQNEDADKDPDLITRPLCESAQVSAPPKHRTCAPKGGSTEHCP